jgi:hypothetical protein
MSVGCFALAALIMAANTKPETIAYRLSTAGSLGRTVLAEGSRTYSPETDVEVETAIGRDGSVRWSKRLELWRGFKLEAYVSRERRLEGFGLVVTSPASPNAFSWNWFDREEGPVFVKRRGTGRLKVTERSIDELVELEAIEFLDDVALTYRDDGQAKDPNERTHELLIKKGSVFRMAR